MERRIVVCAHIDAKPGTPGALDNATGVTILLLLAGLLADYDGRAGIELLAMNGEDHYSAAGELLYLRQNAGRFDEIALLINVDGAGYHTGKTAYSFYECPEEIESAARTALAAHPGLMEGEPWVQGDHSVFLAQGCPALAVTSEEFVEIWMRIAHTPDDTMAQVATEKVVEAAVALRDVIERVDRSRHAPPAHLQRVKPPSC